MWNLLSIVREMYKRNDHNSIPLLEIVTLQCLETAQIMVWWFNTKVAFQQAGQVKHNVNSNSQACQNACASMCDEVVTLWKLAALNPCISPEERETLKQRLVQYHKTVIEKVSEGFLNPIFFKIQLVSGSVKPREQQYQGQHQAGEAERRRNIQWVQASYRGLLSGLGGLPDPWCDVRSQL